MTASELLSSIEHDGGVLTFRGDKVVYELPVEKAEHWLPELRQHREEVLHALRERLARSVKRWLLAQCVAASNCASNPYILHREFSVWSNLHSNEDMFMDELQRLGFSLDVNCMVIVSRWGPILSRQSNTNEKQVEFETARAKEPMRLAASPHEGSACG